MSETKLVDNILHYKRNIEKISTSEDKAIRNEDRLLHCIKKLLDLPITTNFLQKTGVGITINSLRKIEGNKGLGRAARALVEKWKHTVLVEEAREAATSGLESTSQNSSDDEIKKNNVTSEKNSKHREKSEDKKRKHENVEYRPSKKIHSEMNGNSSKEIKKTDTKHSSSSHSSSSKHHSSSSDKYKTHSDKHKTSDNKHKTNEKESSHKASERESSHKTSERESSHKTSERESSHKNSENSHHKSSKSENSRQKETSSKDKERSEKKNDSGIDSKSGASFADALWGPVVVKKPKKKISSTPPSSSKSSPRPSTSGSYTSKKKYESPKSEILSPSELEPLDLDIVDSLPASPEPETSNVAATLPTPTPHYKPLPSVPFDSRKKVSHEHDALVTVMSTKHQRSKVYSGVKGGLPFVPSLYEACCRVLIQHIDALEYTGGIPYSIMKPVLDAASPQQLFNFEHYNPYILDQTDHLWEFHVKREFRNKSKEEFESWRDMYLRCVDEREQKYKAVTANIQKSIKQSLPVRTTKLAYVDNPKPPRNVIRQQMKNGTSKPDTTRLLGRLDPEAVRVPAPKQCVIKESPAIFKVNKGKAPLMQKTLKSIKGASRFKR